MSPRQSVSHNNSYDIIPAVTDNVVYCLTCITCPSTVYIGEIGRSLADRFREHRRDVINGRNDLPVPAHFNQENHTLEDLKVAVLRAGLANQEYLKKQEILGRRCGSFSLLARALAWAVTCVARGLPKTQNPEPGIRNPE